MRRMLAGFIAFLALTGTFLVLPVYAAPSPEAERETVPVVDDQTGTPTWSADLAAGLVAVGAREEPAPPVLHCTNAGQTTWCGLARAVFEELGADPARVLPTTTENFPRPAPRPAYSVLDGAAWQAAGLPSQRPWRVALHEAMSEGFRA